jgi:hypothetical protein
MDKQLGKINLFCSMIAIVLPLGLFRCTRVHLNLCVLKYRLCGTVELDLFVWASYHLLNLDNV